MSSHAFVSEFSSFLFYIPENAKSSWRLDRRGACVLERRGLLVLFSF